MMSIGGVPFWMTAPMVWTILGCLSFVTILISLKRALFKLDSRPRVVTAVFGLESVPSMLLRLLVPVESKPKRFWKESCFLNFLTPKQLRKPSTPLLSSAIEEIWTLGKRKKVR